MDQWTGLHKILQIVSGYDRDNQRDREQRMLLKSISSHRELIPVWEQLATDQFDPWQVVPRQVCTISIFHVCMVWIEKSVTRVTDRHHEACRVMPNSDPE